jgi:hypothetical protein
MDVDPNPGGPKTCHPDSGSATVLTGVADPDTYFEPSDQFFQKIKKVDNGANQVQYILSIVGTIFDIEMEVINTDVPPLYGISYLFVTEQCG